MLGFVLKVVWFYCSDFCVLHFMLFHFQFPSYIIYYCRYHLCVDVYTSDICIEYQTPSSSPSSIIKWSPCWWGYSNSIQYYIMLYYFVLYRYRLFIGLGMKIYFFSLGFLMKTKIESENKKKKIFMSVKNFVPLYDKKKSWNFYYENWIEIESSLSYYMRTIYFWITLNDLVNQMMIFFMRGRWDDEQNIYGFEKNTQKNI